MNQSIKVQADTTRLAGSYLRLKFPFGKLIVALTHHLAGKRVSDLDVSLPTFHLLFLSTHLFMRVCPSIRLYVTHFF